MQSAKKCQHVKLYLSAPDEGVAEEGKIMCFDTDGCQGSISVPAAWARGLCDQVMAGNGEWADQARRALDASVS